MAITFPRLFPFDTFARSMFDLRRINVTSQTGAGSFHTMQRYDPLWEAEYVLPALTREQYGAWHAWIMSLRGGAKRFWAYDPHRPRPINYTTLTGLTKFGGGSFATGEAALVSATGTTFNVNTLPANFVLKAGDYFSIAGAVQRSLHKVTEDVTANASGVAAITAEPAVFLPVSGGAIVYFEKPSVAMRISAVDGLQREVNPTGFTFRAIQSNTS